MSTKNNRIFDPQGGKYPFRVNDEYFDNLAARVMDRIDEIDKEPVEKEEKSELKSNVFDINKNRHRNLWISSISIAASLVLIATLALKFIPTHAPAENEQTEMVAAQTAKENMDYNEDLMTYTMADNMDIYYYLLSEDFEQ
ncbi:MAG: hypothetical protein GXY64_03220 [Bacteroidales bacterium]|nr:hypothetical protein [Bacteroidales bacterium]